MSDLRLKIKCLLQYKDPDKEPPLGDGRLCSFRSHFEGRFLFDTLAWGRIGWLILKLGHLTCASKR